MLGVWILLGFGVWGFGLRVLVSEFMGQGFGFRDEVYGAGFGVSEQGFHFRVLGSGFQVSGFG